MARPAIARITLSRRGPQGAIDPQDRARFDAAVDVAETVTAIVADVSAARDTATGAAASATQAASTAAQDAAAATDGASAATVAATTASEAAATAQASASAGQFASRDAAMAATIAAPIQRIGVATAAGLLEYVRDPAGTALTTADGAKWSPAAAVPSVRHFGAPLDGVGDDAPALNALSAWAAATGRKEIRIDAIIRAATPVELYGGLTYNFGGAIQAAMASGPCVRVMDRGGYEENGVIRGLTIVGNATANTGLKLDHCRYWSFYDLTIRDFTKPGAWGLDLTGLADNRATFSLKFDNTIIANCDNLVLFDKNPLAHYTSEPNFNTFIGGRLGPFGRNDKTFQYGVRLLAGEGNKFLNVRITTNKEWTKCWDLWDARTQLIGCAGDGPVWSAFLYFLDGTTGTINSITLSGTNLMSTPVAWAGSREATALAVVAQIEAEGKQHPATPYRSVAYGDQVIFYTVDANGNDVAIPTDQSAQIAAPKTGDITFGSSALNVGIIGAGAPYESYPDVTRNKWGYLRGHGGNREVYGFYMNAGFSGHLWEPEGNGPDQMIFFDAVNTARNANITEDGANIQADGAIATDAILLPLHGYINVHVAADPTVASIAQSRQNLWIINEGHFITANFELIFVPTIVSGTSHIYIEMPQKAGVYTTTEALDTVGLPYRIAIEASGLAANTAGKTVFAAPQGSTFSPKGLPCLRLYVSDNLTAPLLTTAHMVSGQQVTLRGQMRYPVNRFK